VSGTHVTDQQIRLYMTKRKQGCTQSASAASAGFFQNVQHGVLIGRIETDRPSHYETGAPAKIPYLGSGKVSYYPYLSKSLGYYP